MYNRYSNGTNCAPLPADLFLHAYKADFRQWLLENKDRKLAITILEPVIIRAQLQTHKMLKQGYFSPSLRSLWTFFGRHHDLVDRYEIFISQMTMDLFLYLYVDFYRTSLYIWVTRRVSYKKQEELLTLHQYLVSPSVVAGAVLLIFGVFRVVFLFCIACLRRVSCVRNVASVSGLSILRCPFGFL